MVYVFDVDITSLVFFPYLFPPLRYYKLVLKGEWPYLPSFLSFFLSFWFDGLLKE
jgi:hypothetical protein